MAIFKMFSTLSGVSTVHCTVFVFLVAEFIEVLTPDTEMNIFIYTL